MRRSLVLAAILLAGGCATRGSISELGRPEFADAVPDQVQLTLVEPRLPGELHAYPRGAGEGDYHCEIRMEEAPHRLGDNVVFVMRATPTGDKKLKLFEVAAWPLLSKHVVRFKEDGHPPGMKEPAGRESSRKPIPDSEAFGVIVKVPVARLAGVDQIGVSSLLQFEDGWITIVDSAVLAPVESASR